MKTILIYTLSALMILLSACNKEKIPGVYRVEIQQGNAITQDMVNQLKSGMTKKQVAYVMGTPLLIDTFHPNRWDYIYSSHPGNGSREQRKLTLYFSDNDTLDFVKGDIRVVEHENLPQTERSDVNVIVPLQEKKVGIFRGLLNTLGLGNDDAETAIITHNEEESLPDTVDEAKAMPTPSPSKELDNSATMVTDEEDPGLFQNLLSMIGLGSNSDEVKAIASEPVTAPVKHGIEYTETNTVMEPEVKRPETNIVMEPEVEIPETNVVMEPEVEIPETNVVMEPEVEIPETNVVMEPEVEIPETNVVMEPEVEIPATNVVIEPEIESYEEEKTGLFKRFYNSFGIGDYAYDE